MKTTFQKSKEKLLLRLFQEVRGERELQELLSALFTPAECETLAERVNIIHGILSGKTQRDVSSSTGASLATVSRGSRELKFGNGIFQKLFQRVGEKF